MGGNPTEDSRRCFWPQTWLKHENFGKLDRMRWCKWPVEMCRTQSKYDIGIYFVPHLCSILDSIYTEMKSITDNGRCQSWSNPSSCFPIHWNQMECSGQSTHIVRQPNWKQSCVMSQQNLYSPLTCIAQWWPGPATTITDRCVICNIAFGLAHHRTVW